MTYSVTLENLGILPCYKLADGDSPLLQVSCWDSPLLQVSCWDSPLLQVSCCCLNYMKQFPFAIMLFVHTYICTYVQIQVMVRMYILYKCMYIRMYVYRGNLGNSIFNIDYVLSQPS